MSILYKRRSPRFAPKRVKPIERCRNCGCTNDDCSRCVAKTGSPCFWFEPDLCSACVPPFYLVERAGAVHLFVRLGQAQSLCNLWRADVEADQELVLFRPDDLEPGPNGCRRCFTFGRDFIGLVGKGGAA